MTLTPAPPVGVVPVKGTVILHVDDNPGERLLIVEAFNELKRTCRMSFAGDGHEAIQVLQECAMSSSPELPALILLDVSMPRMGGLELLAFLKKHHDWRSIPVVMLTNSQRPQERSAAAALGSDGFEIKPQNFEGYLDLVRRLEEQVPTIRPQGSL